ncbi:hypothetical protein L596_021547 [Steinernema carpocapsae]|uniref:Uncharacterized protein n=1 Tax=Steinernema carpocapsae TaxID=34508 RepID=A0A4U5MJ33_STECR|nr:hypothetical protein L596_021547 [Steinernema carpocapsae]
MTSAETLLELVVHTVYIFTKITNWVPERFACTVACAFFTLFYLVTYPWPFLSHKLKPDSLLEVLSNDSLT